MRFPARLGMAVACAALLAGGAAPFADPQPAAHATQPGQSRTRLALVSQSPYVGAGGDFTVRVRIDRTALPATAEVLLTIFRPVQTRSEFEETIQDRLARSPAVPSIPFPLTSLPFEAGDVATLRVPLLDRTQGGDASRVDLSDGEGVYPVRVELRDRGDRGGASLDRFTTHLVHLPDPHAGPKLGVSLVFPVQSGLSLPPDGPRQVPGLDDLVASVMALEAVRGLPFVLEPSPETIAALAAHDDDRARRALDGLRRLASDHPVVAGPYVPVNLPALVSGGLPEELTSQVSRGMAVLSDALLARPDNRTWVETEPLDPESIDALVDRGVERMVTADVVLEPVPEQNLTLSRPFVLAGREEDVPAVAADGGLAAHFNGEINQVLAAHHLLADLAVLWLDAPGDDRRAVVALPPPQWRANRAFLDALVAGLNQNPVVEPVSLDTVFTGVTPAVTGRGLALVRHPAEVRSGGLGEVVPEIRQARRQLTSLATVLTGPTPSSVLLEERLLVSQSSELRASRARQAYVDAVDTGIADQLRAIEMPQGRSITLTARRAELPVTFQNRTGAPVKVVVTVQSDKLEFPNGASRSIDLDRRNTTEEFSVVSRTSGAFPLQTTLQSPDGNLVIGQARMTVRSTAASRVSLVVSLGAALFLAVWWARHIARGRRARRLIPA